MTTLETWESLTPEQMRHIIACAEAENQTQEIKERDWYQIMREGWNIPGLDDTPDEVIINQFKEDYEDVDEESKRLILINCDIIPEPEQ